MCCDQASILQRQHQKCYLSRRQRHGNRKPRTVSRRCTRHWRPPPLDVHGLTTLDSSVENVQISDVTIIPANGNVGNGGYMKTWIGSLQLQTAGNGAYESGGGPRGGGWGVVRNILFSNFKLHGPDHGTAITQNSGHNGSAYLPGKLQVSNVAFINFTGSASATSK